MIQVLCSMPNSRKITDCWEMKGTKFYSITRVSKKNWSTPGIFDLVYNNKEYGRCKPNQLQSVDYQIHVLIIEIHRSLSLRIRALQGEARWVNYLRILSLTCEFKKEKVNINILCTKLFHVCNWFFRYPQHKNKTTLEHSSIDNITISQPKISYLKEIRLL